MRRDTQGFTLIEVIVVISILGIILGIVATGFYSLKSAKSLDKAAAQIVGLMEEARSSTLSAKGDDQYGIHLESGRAVLFEGDTYDADAATNIAVVLDGSVTITDIDLALSSDDIVFNRLTGATSNYGTTTVTLIASTTEQKYIVVHPTGLIELK